MFRDDEIKYYKQEIKTLEKDKYYYSKFLSNLREYNDSIDKQLAEANRVVSSKKWVFLLNMGLAALNFAFGNFVLGGVAAALGAYDAVVMVQNGAECDKLEKVLEHNKRVELEVQKYVRFLNSKITFESAKVKMLEKTYGKSFETYWAVHNMVGPAKYVANKNELAKLEDFHTTCIKKLNEDMKYELNLDICPVQDDEIFEL
ncbi:MAG: hypothetical protein IJA69_01045 [Clostridia bacterium]|nr:hypothetical protein [Clostridia bacterium]